MRSRTIDWKSMGVSVFLHIQGHKIEYLLSLIPGFKLIKPSFLKDNINISPQKFINAKLELHCRSDFRNLIISNAAMVELDEGKNQNKQNPLVILGNNRILEDYATL